MSPAFETERLLVRDWRPEEAGRVFDIYSRPEVAKWLGATPRPMTSLDHGLDEVFAVVQPTIAASVAVCRRLGMAELGLTDRYYATTMELYRPAADVS